MFILLIITFSSVVLIKLLNFRVQGHPNITVIYGVCSEQKWLIMELADCSLKKVGLTLINTAPFCSLITPAFGFSFVMGTGMSHIAWSANCAVFFDTLIMIRS